MHPLASVEKRAKFKSGLVPIPISSQDIYISYCHVYIIEGAFFLKCIKVVVSGLYI